MLPTTLLLAAADAELFERWRAFEALPLPPGVSPDDDAVIRSSSAGTESIGGVDPSASSPPGRTCLTARRMP